MPKASTIAALMTGALPLVVVAGALVLGGQLTRMRAGPRGELDRVATPTPGTHEADTEPEVDTEQAPITAQPASTLSLVRASREVVTVERNAVDAPELFDEASLLSNLHDLDAADPPQSLRLARQAVERFPDSPNAPEFQWNVVKALFNMGRLDEARSEARAMLGKYPNSSLTGDVIHHLLNPPPNPREQ